MNDNRKTYKGCYIPVEISREHCKHKPSKLYQQRDMWCREGSLMYSSHRSHRFERKIYQRVLRAKLKEEVMAIIKKDTQN